MPLIIDRQPMTSVPSSVNEFIHTYPQFQIESRNFSSIPPIHVKPNEPYLYVHQIESACLRSDDPQFEILATDDVTTCCCVIFRHNGSRAVAMGHFDGNDTKNGVEQMVRALGVATSHWVQQNRLSEAASAPRNFDAYLIGGFDDARNISQDVVMQLLKCLSEMTDTSFHLRLACVCANNTHYKDNIPYPNVTGIFCNVRTGTILPASYSFKGPLMELRLLKFSQRPPIIMHCVYGSATSPAQDVLEVKAYESTFTNDTIQQLLGLNANSFLHYWSTSPLAEKADFVPNCKLALKFLAENRRSLFPHGQSYYFIRQNGQWRATRIGASCEGCNSKEGNR